MRDFFIYTILCLFCFAPAAAQEVPFEGLHLDDLISIPGERKPGIINHPVSAFELPGFKLLPSGHAHLLRHYPGISLPSMPPVPFPEKNNLRSYSFWQPLKRLTISFHFICLLTICPTDTVPHVPSIRGEQVPESLINCPTGFC